MWERIKSIILSIFGKKSFETDEQAEKNKSDVLKYQDTTKHNLTAVFANTLSTLAFSDSSVNISSGSGLTSRSEFLNNWIQEFWKDIKQNIANGNGSGMIVTIPYVTVGELGTKIYADTVMKDRVFITATQGDDITALTIMSDIIKRNYHVYIRWTDYSIGNGTYIIRQAATVDDKPCPLSKIAEWANIPEEIRINNVDKLPVGIYRCPTSNRRTKNIYGVPLTYGCDEVMNKIAQVYTDIEEEFENKKSRIFADKILFGKDQKLGRLFVNFEGSGKLGEGNSLDIFDPAFRETAYYTKLSNLYADLEKAVGTSRGILTDLQTKSATATEIKQAMHQTFSLCDDIHESTEKYIDGLIYGVNILCNAYNITPSSEYDINYNWSYSLIEDTQAEFQQLSELHSKGLVCGERLNMWATGQTEDEARAEIAKEKQNNIVNAVFGDEGGTT